MNDKRTGGPEDPTGPSYEPDDLDDDGREQYGEDVLEKAIRFSIAAVLLIAAVVAAVFWLRRPQEETIVEKVTPLEAPAPQARPEAAVPSVSFTDITNEAGIDFVHNNGATGEKLLPETMGGGVAFFDYDLDGDADLLFVNSNWWPEDIRAGKSPTTSRLYRNDGGRFTDVTRGCGLDIPLYGMGAAVGDYDGDGLPDVFLTTVGQNRLFRNLGEGRFRDVTASVKVGGDPKGWSSGATWLDADQDGDLDLFVCNYIRWSRELDVEVGYSLTGIGRAYGPPMNFEGTFPELYLNNGDGTFNNVSEESGVQVRNISTNAPASKSLAVCPVDFDKDGRIDLVVANDTVPNLLLRNLGGGKFEEVGAEMGIAFDSYGNARGAMGIDSGFILDQSSVAVAIGNFANEMSALYVTDEVSGMFLDEAIAHGIGPATRQSLTFGLFFFDYDLDGWLDLLQVNGHLEDEIQAVQPSQHYEQPAQLFWNAGASGGGYKAVTPAESGEDIFRPLVGRGSAYADIDSDGDLDVVFTQVGGPPRLLRNEQNTKHHWLQVRCSDPGSRNPHGIGAEVRLYSGNEMQHRRVLRTRSYLSQSEAVAAFGLGSTSAVDSLVVNWPDGRKQVIAKPAVDRIHTIESE